MTLKKRDWKEAFPFAEFELAKALGAANRDIERARRLAEEGVAGLKGVTGAEAQEKEGEAWLAEWEEVRPAAFPVFPSSRSRRPAPTTAPQKCGDCRRDEASPRSG